MHSFCSIAGLYLLDVNSVTCPHPPPQSTPEMSPNMAKCPLVVMGGGGGGAATYPWLGPTAVDGPFKWVTRMKKMLLKILASCF